MSALALVMTIAVAVFLSIGNKEESTMARREKTLRIACVGDSITYGYGLEPREGNDYPAKLQAMLGKGYEVKNFGLSGRCVQRAADKPYVLENAYEESRAFAPQIVILMLGTNDTKRINWNKETFINDYKALLESYKNATEGVQEVYVVLPPPLYCDESIPTMPRGSVMREELVPILKDLAQQYGCKTIDLFTVFQAQPALLYDGCHPTIEGAELIAKTVYEKLLSDKI